MRSYISLDGIMSYLKNVGTPLFSAVSLPSGIDRDTLVNTIYQDGAEFGIIYPDPTFFRNRVNAWFLTKYKTFDKWNNVLNMDYNPIENYDRMEAWTDSGSISDTGSRTDSGTSHDTTESTTTLNGSTTTENETSGTESGTTSGTTSETGRKQTDTTGSETDTDSKTEIIDQDGTSTSTTTATTTTETKVSAFNDGDYQPKEQVLSNSTTTVNGATTNDQTTTTTDRLTKATTGQEIEQNTNSSTTSGTTSGTTSETEEGSETRHDVTNFESESNGRTTLESRTTGSRESDGEHEGRVHGNIGVTTTQQMIEQELSLRKNYNIYNMISDSFCDEFLIQVY